jgi:16S rRNA (adenine1518-N6/adenine1519-N6)-dimethyltransferase
MVHPKKHLGQHFLHDPRIIDRILSLLDIHPDDHFLEIGPGPATLTLPLNRKGFSFPVIEVDSDMVQFLRNQPFDPPIDIIEDDILKCNLEPLLSPSTKVFSNLPYNISVPITARLLPYASRIPLMVLMYQKEVAMRIQADPGSKDYGPISVLVQCFYRINAGFNLAPGAFKPPPRVDSRVLAMKRRDSFLISEDEIEKMRYILNILFSQRRKMVRSVLKKQHLSRWMDVYDAEGEPTARPENLSPEFYANWLKEVLKKTHE